MIPLRPSQEELELLPLLQADSLQDMSTMASSYKQPDMINEKSDSDSQIERATSSSPPLTHQQFTISAAEKKLVRKLDMRIMPIACILYLFACESLSMQRYRHKHFF
jgi:hypothetical protein